MSKGTKTTIKGNKGTTIKGDATTFPLTRDIVALQGETFDAYKGRIAKIDEKIVRLRDCTSRNEGKMIRRQLRALGHFGGLRHERGQRNALNVASNVVANARPDTTGRRDAC